MTTINPQTRIPDVSTMLRLERELFDRIDASDGLRDRRAVHQHLVKPRIVKSGRALTGEGRRRSRRGLRVIGVGSLGTGMLVVALVLTNVLGFAGWRGGAEPAAAAMLEQAALNTIAVSDPTLGVGDYLKIETTSMSTSYSESTGYATVSTDQIYVPKDRAQDWVWIRPMSKLYETFGPKSAAAARADFAAQEAEYGADYVEKLRAPGGRWYSGESNISTKALADLPADPTQLLNYIYRTTLGSGVSPDDEALSFIADRLRTGAIPAHLRASLYKAAALIPGVGISEHQATLNGRTGTAIGRLETKNHLRLDIIIDPETGQFIGERTTQTQSDYVVPAGTTIKWSAVTTSVVSSAPAGGTINGAFDDKGCVTTNGYSVCPN